MPDLYGKLNKEVRIYNYDGVETDTAKVTVDNKTQDISVDVKRVPNELTLTTINGDTYTYDGSEPASFDIRTQVTDKVEEGNNLPVTSDAVKGYVDSKAGALEYVGGEGNFTNINGGVTVKGRLNVDDGIYSPVNSDDPNFVPNNKSVDDKITASEQKLIDERIGAFTRTEDKLFTDVTGGMTIKGHLNVDGGITSPTEPTSSTDVANKGYVDDNFVHKGTANKAVYGREIDGTETMVPFNDAITPYIIVQRGEGGVVRVPTPTEDDNATPKKYVDDADAKKLNLTGGTITGSLAIQGDLTVTGTTTTEKAQTLAVKDSVIVTNADGAELGATLSGIAIKKDGENTYGVMYDPSGDSVKLGLGTLDAENKFTFNESGTDGKAIATRDDSSNLTDGDLVKWDGTTNSLVDSGKKTDDFVEKVTNTTTSTKAYIAKTDGSQGTIDVATGVAADTLAQRGAHGRLQVGTAVADSDAMTKKQVEDGFVAKIGTETQAGTILYGRTHTGEERGFVVGAMSHEGNTIVQRKSDGTVEVYTPSADNDATTKEYVDSALKKKLDTYTGTAYYPVIPVQRRISASDPSAGYYQAWEQMSVEATNNTVAKRTANGTVATAIPKSDKDATPKKYVEDNFVAKQTTTSGDYVYGYNSSGDSTYKVSANDDSNTIVLRDSDTGGIKVGTINCSSNIYSNGSIHANDATLTSIGVSRLGVDTYVSLAGEITVAEGSNIVNSTAPTDDSHLTNKKYVDDNFVPKTTTPWRVYATNGAGNQGLLNYTAELSNLALVQRDSSGRAKIQTPVNDMEIANKKYVDDGFVAKVTPSNNLTYVYSRDENGDKSVQATSMTTGNTVAYRDANGNISVGTPTADDHAATKKYVDDGFVHKGTEAAAVYCINREGIETMIPYNEYAIPFTLVRRVDNGIVKVGTPVGVSDATPKAYVDNLNTITITAGA